MEEPCAPQKKNQEINPKYTTKTVKHDESNVKVPRAFSWHEVEPLLRTHENIDNHVTLNKLNITVESYLCKSMTVNWTFMYDKDLKAYHKVV